MHYMWYRIIKTHGSELRGEVKYTVSYLRERLTLIFAREIQAGKSNFLKITSRYKPTFSSLFYRGMLFRK